MEQKVKIPMKLFAFIMALLMLLVSLPVSAFASAISTNSNNDTSTNINAGSETVKKDVIVLEEDETLRDENTKHFKLSDGTTKAVVYSQAVHYKDEDGKWVDIDNALTLNGSEYSSNNKQSIKFANKSGSTGLVSIKDGDYKIDFTPLNTNKVSVVIENPQGNNSRKFEDMSVLNNLVSKAIYTDIYDGIDIEYILVGNNIKENIIVKEKQDSYTFSFELKLNKLSAELKDGAIILSDYDSGEQVYEIPAPYMFDANNVYSDNVEYSLVQNNKWKYTFTVTADAEWINSEERAFPVIVDPTLGSLDGLISDISIGKRASVFPSYLSVGKEFKSYIKTKNLPSLVKDAYITHATIDLKRYSGSDSYVAAYNVIKYWDENITWDNTLAPSYAGSYLINPLDYNYITSHVELIENPDDPNGEKIEKEVYGNDGWFSWDITSAVRSWYNGATNYGICFTTVGESQNASFYSIDSDDSTRPMITVSYRDMKGIESYWTYISQSAINAGVGNVNLATGNLVFQISTLTTTDNLFGFTPTMIYNSAIAGEQYEHPNAMIGYWGSYAAKGFKMNFHETLIRDSFINKTGDSETYYIWADSDGTEHYFLMDEQGVYHDEDGLQLTLTIDTETDVCTIKDSTHTERIFVWNLGAIEDRVEKTYYLSSIRDKNGNKLNFVVDGARRPEYVRVQPNNSNEINMINMLYNSSSMIYAIWNTYTGDAVLFRHSDTPTGELNATGGEFLREVLFLKCDTSTTRWSTLRDFIAEVDNVADGITVNAIMEYEYDENGYLICAKDTLTDYKIEYTYSNGKVTNIIEYGKDNAQGQKVAISYYSGYTEVRSSGTDDIYGNEDDLINVYVFDNEGRVTTTYTTDVSRSIMYGATNGQYEDEIEKAKNNIKISSVVGSQSQNYLLNGDFEDSYEEIPYWGTSGNVVIHPNYTSDDQCNTKEAELNLSQNTYSSLYQYVYLAPGDYTLSLDVLSSNSSDIDIKMEVICVADTTIKFTEDIPVNDKRGTINDYFSSMNFTVSGEGVQKFKVEISASAQNTISSPIYIDSVMLAKGSGVNDFNFVTQGSFENTHAGTTNNDNNENINIGNVWNEVIINSNNETNYIPVEKYTLNTSNNDVTIYDSHTSFGNVLKISGSIGEEHIVEQTVFNDSRAEGPLNKQIVINISAFGKADAIMNGSNSEFGIRVAYVYQQGEETLTNGEYFPFSQETNDWQYVTGSIVIPKGIKLLQLNVACVYSNNVGKALFDEISLVKDVDNATSQYEFYEDGKVKFKQIGKTGTFYKYDNVTGNVTDVINRKEIIKYIYQEENPNRIEKEQIYSFSGYYSYDDKNYDEIIKHLGTLTLKASTEYKYNALGLNTVCTIFDAQEQTKIVSKNVYYESGQIVGALKTSEDALGNITRYFYNEKNGYLIAMIEPNGRGIYYTYDDFGNIVSMQAAMYSSVGDALPITGSGHINFEYNSANQLATISANGTKYHFSYDIFGNSENISIGETTIIEQEINANNGKTIKVSYANGVTIRYSYDELERVSEIRYQKQGEEDVVYTYTYDSKGNIYKLEDSKNKTATMYDYDLSGKLTGYYVYNTETGVIGNSNFYVYDDQSRLSWTYHNKDYLISAQNGGYYSMYLSYIYTYNINDSVEKIAIAFIDELSKYVLEYTYDEFDRVDEKTITLDYGFCNYIDYSYLSNGSNTSTWINEYVTKVHIEDDVFGENIFRYEYDANGNVTTIKDGDNTIIYSYEYDTHNRLYRENNRELNKTIIYIYDSNGNIKKSIEYEFTLDSIGSSNLIKENVYTYSNGDWKDQVTSYNGQEITYDAMGNPLEYLDLNFTWDNVRELATITKDGKTVATYTYNEEGIRTSKTIDGVTHEYSLEGTTVVFESYGEIFIAYFYDESGLPIGMAYRDGNGKTETTSNYTRENEFEYYLFTKNLQGDIIGIYGWDEGISDYNCVAKYDYDAWGNHTVTNYTSDNIGDINPFRYRGYFYDSETNFYYLNSRYYDPEIKRFINADDISYLGENQDLDSYNLYAYCGNNPVMGYDPMGTWNWGTFFSGVNLLAVGVTAIAVAATVLSCGAAAPLMVAVAAVTVVAGAATAVNGVAEIVEAGTDYNFVRDGLMGGNEEAYETYKTTTQLVAEIGTMIVGGYYAKKGGNVCFVAGTLVLAEIGQVAIETIEAGDYVWATNTDTGETELKRVVRTFKNEATELVHITIGGETITCTNEHPFYSPVKGWTAACKLRAGDMLVTVNGEYVIVEWVQHEILESPVAVYNFEVEDFHTYYVGDNDGVLVHNRCKPDTEVHHIVEQCQVKKSGFANDIIQSQSNKVTLDYNVHRQVSAYYSSKKPFTNGLRVRDWLAGQSFEFQTEFGWNIVKMFRGF